MHIILSSSLEGVVVGKGDGEGEVSTLQEEMSPATADLRANVRGEGAGSSMDVAHFQSHDFITPKEKQDFRIQKSRRRKEKAEEQEAARIFRLEMEEMKKQLAMMKAALQLTSGAPILPPPTTCYTTTHALQAVSPHMAVVPLPTTMSMAPPVTTVAPHVLPMAEIVYESEIDVMSNPPHLRPNHTLHAPGHGIFTNSDSLGFGSPLEVDAQATLGQPKLMKVHLPDPAPVGCGTKGGPEVDIVDYEPHNDDLIDSMLQERADGAYDIEVHLQIDLQSNTKVGSADKCNMLESVHRPTALKSLLSGGILEFMCAMGGKEPIKPVFSPLSGSAFLQYDEPGTESFPYSYGGTVASDSMHRSLLSGGTISRGKSSGSSLHSNFSFMFLALDATSAIVDFSKENVDDGVVNSRLVSDTWATPISGHLHLKSKSTTNSVSIGTQFSEDEENNNLYASFSHRTSSQSLDYASSNEDAISKHLPDNAVEKQTTCRQPLKKL